MNEETSKYNKLTDFPSYEKNPSILLERDIKKRNYIEQGEVKIFVNPQGEEELYQSLGKDKYYTTDAREYRKIYVEQLGCIKELSNPALKVLCYILKELKPRVDEIAILIDDCMKFTGYESKVNIYKGLVELLNRKLIYRKVGTGTYFIDINSFYNGNRL